MRFARHRLLLPVATVCGRRRLLRGAVLKHQTLTGFLGEYADDRHDRHHDVEWHATETSITGNHLITHFQVAYRALTQVQDDFTVFHKSVRHFGVFIDAHRQIGGQTAIHAPFVNCTDQVWARRQIAHYLRIALSEGVSASIKP